MGLVAIWKGARAVVAELLGVALILGLFAMQLDSLVDSSQPYAPQHRQGSLPDPQAEGISDTTQPATSGEREQFVEGRLRSAGSALVQLVKRHVDSLCEPPRL